MIPADWMPWIWFNLFVLALLALDLGVFHRGAAVMKFRESIIWSVIWIIIALLFNGWIWYWRGKQPALEFFTGYLIERSLSIDNLFVFLVIFSYFRVPAQYQYKVLFWGILGALVMRAMFIAAGVALIRNFHWIIYVFGAFLIFTGIKMSTHKDEEIEPEKNPVLKLFRKLVPMTSSYQGVKFFVKESGKWVATPLALVLVVVETTDLIFAVDSIPAILAITPDPYIVYTSNVFAILGLRALYFALAGIMNLFHFIHYGLSAVLVFVGSKMLLVDLYEIPIGISLAVVAGLLGLSVLASLIWPEKADESKALQEKKS